MKYFIVLTEYKTSSENIIKITDAHREFLKSGYSKGFLLLSGPRVPRTGGVIIGKSESREDLEKFFSQDPYILKSYADYHYIEFEPKSRQPFLDDWIS